MGVPRSNLTSTHFLAIPLGKEDQFEFKVSQDHDNNGKGDLTDASNEKNIIHPSTIDQLLEELCKMVEDKTLLMWHPL